MTSADLMAAGDQFGCKDLMRATSPVTWGQAIEVPDRNSYESTWSLLAGRCAAKMSTRRRVRIIHEKAGKTKVLRRINHGV